MIKNTLRKVYNILEEGSKMRAAQIHGVTPAYFKRIVNGEPKDIAVFYSALEACKQASSELLAKVNKTHETIKKIAKESINSIEVTL